MYHDCNGGFGFQSHGNIKCTSAVVQMAHWWVMSASDSAKCCQSRNRTLDAILGASKEPNISKLVPLTRTASMLGQTNREREAIFYLPPIVNPSMFWGWDEGNKLCPLKTLIMTIFPPKVQSQFDIMPCFPFLSSCPIITRSLPPMPSFLSSLLSSIPTFHNQK